MNILGIDFEDWFHPQLIQRYVRGIKKEPSVIRGIEKILEMLRINDVYATFFVVGELLEYDPSLLDKIMENGHEIGFHTMHHDRLDSSGFKEHFCHELELFDNMTGKRSKGFRAPTFSLNYDSAWALDVLAEHGYVYDSSIVPVKTELYGIDTTEFGPYRISSSSLNKNDPNGSILEFPLAVGKVIIKKIPIAGGFYLRFLPLGTITKSIQAYEKRNIPATFYIHSWELTPEYMPRIHMSFKDSFITYHNIQKALPRMDSLLKRFEFTSFTRYMSKYG